MGKNTNLHPVYEMAKRRREAIRRPVLKLRTAKGMVLEVSDIGSLIIVVKVSRTDACLQLSETFRLHPDGTCSIAILAEIRSTAAERDLPMYRLEETFRLDKKDRRYQILLDGLRELLEDEQTVTMLPTKVESR